ncbi:MAG: hypothetical protein JNG86_08545 [Verrucomicrobiaceae bacterium]|nr:hypothetical protein [Verrucomicrobiaceae bacterium]
MNGHDYFPNCPGEQPEWLKKLADKVPGCIAPLGLDPAEVADRVADARCLFELQSTFSPFDPPVGCS